MSLMTTERLALPLISSGQAQKEIVHNEALLLLDMLVQPVVESADLSAPPGAPVTGQCWIVATSGTGDWTEMDNALAVWTGAGWRFAQPLTGWHAWVADRSGAMLFDGASWSDAQARADGFYVGGVRTVAAQQPAIADPSGGSAPDTEARASIVSILAALRAHGLIGT